MPGHGAGQFCHTADAHPPDHGGRSGALRAAALPLRESGPRDLCGRLATATPCAHAEQVRGQIHTARATLTINTAINGGVKALILGKNRNVLTSGTILTLIYNIPPTTPWSLTPLTIEAQAVDPKGAPIPVITESGWLGINEGSP